MKNFFKIKLNGEEVTIGFYGFFKMWLLSWAVFSLIVIAGMVVVYG